MKTNIILFFVLLLLSMNFVSAVIIIDSCQILNLNNTEYQLNQSINSSLTCLTLAGNNISVDGRGFNITYSQAGNSSYGVYIAGYNFSTIKNFKIYESSTLGNTRYGIYIANSTDSLIQNNTIVVAQLNGHGIFVSASQRTKLISNFVSSAGTSSYPIYLTNSHNSTLYQNNLTSSGSSSQSMYLQSSSNNNITSNNITAITLNGVGLYLASSSASNLINFNNILTKGGNGYGIYLASCSYESINYNFITTTGSNSYGMDISTSANGNIINSNILNITSGHRIVVDGSSVNNNLTNNSFINRNRAFYDINIATGCNGLWLIDQVNLIENYTFGSVGSKISIRDSVYGEIKFNATINGTGNNLSSDIRISDNLVSVDSLSNIGFNKSANITLYNIGNRGFSSPKLFRNNLICPSDICINDTSLISTNVTFRVTGWTNYSIQDESALNVNITFIFQNPVDIDSLNIFSNLLNINYSIISNTGLNQSSIFIYYKTNNTNSETSYFVNGTSINGFQQKSYFSNSSDYYLFKLSDSQIYPAIYNMNETLMENTPHTLQALTTASDYVSIELFNISNSKQYSFFEIMANRTTGIQPLRYYYCNSSYVFGVSNSPDINSNCVQYFSDTDGTYNHTHTQYSSHKIATFSVNTTSGTINGIKITSTSYFMIRGSTNWQYYYINNTSRTNAIRTTSNNAISWVSQNYTVDAHIHQFNGNDSLWYYVCANDGLNNPVCSSLREDLLNLSGLPPSSPSIYNPTTTFYHGNIAINYTSSISPNNYPVNFYNITLLNVSFSFVQTIIANNSNHLGYIYNSSLVPDGFYIIKVTSCDSNNLCSNGFSNYFGIDNTLPFGDLLNPINDSFFTNPFVNFSVNVTDNSSLQNITLNIYNSSGSLVYNETINASNQTSGIFSAVYTFLTNGIFNWFFLIYDTAGNFFQTIIRYLHIISLPSVLISYPINAENYSYSITSIQYSVSNGDSCWYSLDNGLTNVSLDCNGNSINGLLSNVGINTWVIFANNTIGNETYAQTTFNSTCFNPEVTLSLTSNVYVDINSSFNFRIYTFLLGVSNITLEISNSSGFNQSFFMIYNSTTQSYSKSLIFSDLGDYYYNIYGDGVCPTLTDNITGTLLVRQPFYVTIQAFENKSTNFFTTNRYKNDFAYVLAEYSNVRDGNIRTYTYPISFPTNPSFSGYYNNGIATLKLYEPNRTYALRLIDGDLSFPSEYSVPNLTKTYGTNIYLGQIKLNGTNENLNVLLQPKDIRPYFYIFNWVLLGLIIMSILVGLVLFFVFPHMPWISLGFGIGVPVMLVLLRIIIYFYWG